MSTTVRQQHLNSSSTSIGAASSPEQPEWFTDHMLFHYRRCRRRTYLDTYGNPTDKDPPSDYFTKLRQDSAEHRQAIL
ncbi:MAG: hypothetical protein AAF635_16230, partial [Cyanobacteria bacterium P01_C01_bin.69]